MKFGVQTITFLIGAFLFRLWYGTGKFSEEKAFHNFLIGLRNYCTGHTDWWGPDLPTLDNRIPGSLQGLLISAPMSVYEHPLSAVLLLNFLTFAVMVGLAWYLLRRVPALPSWFVYAWVLLSPWSLQYSCHLDPLSYALVGAVLFFIGVIELGGIYQQRLIPANLAFFMAGFGLVWVIQLHPDWGLLLPFVPFVIWVNRQDKKGILLLLAGALAAGLMYWPWLTNVGLNIGREAQLFFGFHPENAQKIPVLVYRFFAMATTDLSGFTGDTFQKIQAYILENGFLGILALALMVLSIALVGSLIGALFSNKNTAEWRSVRDWTKAIVLWLLVGVCFLNSTVDAQTVFLFFPVSLWYAAHAYGELAHRSILDLLRWEALLAVVLFHCLTGLKQQEKTGLLTNLDRVKAAFQYKNDALAGARIWSKPERERIALSKIWTPQKSVHGDACYFTGFEYADPYFKPVNIFRGNSFKGQYCQRLDSVSSVGLDFNVLKVKDVHGEISGTLYLYYLSADDQQVNMNLLVQSSGQYIPMGSWPVKASAEWKMLVLDIQTVRGLVGDGEIRLTLEKANRKAAPLYLDDVEICLHPLNPDR